MKRLYGTADLEAELFGTNVEPEEVLLNTEPDLDAQTEEALKILENITEEEIGEFPALELTLELSDGSALVFELAAVFIHGEKEYAALHPKTDSEGLIHLMELLKGENDEIQLKQIETEEELEAVYATFCELFANTES